VETIKISDQLGDGIKFEDIKQKKTGSFYQKTGQQIEAWLFNRLYCS
jgi:hypothetical protein